MSHQERVRVLIAEDDCLVSKMIGGLLEDIGYTVVGEAADGLEAVEMTQSLRPDVVLMDIKMPVMDGIEAMRLIYERCPTPVVVLTAYETPEMVEEASAAGAGAYVVKPPYGREMEQAITIAMARFDDMMALRRLNAELQAEITERKQLEAQLLQAQKMESIGRLAAGITHDFDNLLTPISGFAELLLRKAPEGSQQHEYLRQIQVAAGRAAALTRQLRLFTRQEEGERRPVQLNSVVEETRDLLERSIPKDITIELGLESGVWAVEADPSQMSQVLVNLCLNARDAMPNGGTLTLETRNVTLDEEQARAILKARLGRYVCLSVSDTGCGMSPEVQARLFEPFFTTKEMDEGTGLGLSVVYGIVKGHGGFINVHSEVGRGSIFQVYLPAVEVAVEERG